MGTPGPLELIIIFAVVLLIFGAKRIPEIARGIGKGIREFKDATSEISREIEAEGQKRQINQPQAPQQGTPQSRQPEHTQSPPPSQQQEHTQSPPPSQQEREQASVSSEADSESQAESQEPSAKDTKETS